MSDSRITPRRPAPSPDQGWLDELVTAARKA